MPKADEILLQLKAENDQLKAKLKESEKAVDKFSKKGADSVGKLNKTLSRIKKLAVFGIVTRGLFAIGKAAFSASAEMEKNKIAFETMLGSASKAKTLLKEIQVFSASTPLQLPEIVNASKKLLAFGETAENIVPTIRRIGDVAAGLSIPLNDLAEIYGKARVQQTLYAEDINQLAGRGVPVFTELAKVMGVNAGQIKKLASEGKIGFAQLEQAFVNMTSEGGKFSGLLEKQSRTLAGVYSTLGDKLGLLSQEMGDEMNPELIKLADAMFNAAQDGGVLHTAMKAITVIMKGAIKLATNLINTLNRFFDEKLQARIESGEEVLNSVTNAIKLGIEMNKKKLKQMEDEEAPTDKIIEQRMKIVALESELAFNEAEAAKAKKKTVILLGKETKELEENTKSLNANKRARKRVTPGTSGEGKDPRLEEIKLLKFLGEQELAEQMSLQIQQETMLKNHKDKETEIRLASDLKRRQIEQKFVQFRIQNGLTILSATSNMLGQIGQLLSMNSQNNINRLDQEQEKRREEIENTITDQTERDEALASLDEEFQRKKIKEQRKAAKIQKKIAIAETLISIPQAAFAAFKSLAGIPIIGPALGAAAATAATLLGLKKVQLIKDQPLPSFQRGTVPSGVPGNHFPAMIGSDEAVINGRSTRNNAELLDMINRNPQVNFSPVMTPPEVKSQVTVNIGPRVLYDQLSDAIDNGELRVSKVSI